MAEFPGFMDLPEAALSAPVRTFRVILVFRFRFHFFRFREPETDQVLRASDLRPLGALLALFCGLRTPLSHPFFLVLTLPNSRKFLLPLLKCKP
jgi:hypothetical protein